MASPTDALQVLYTDTMTEMADAIRARTVAPGMRQPSGASGTHAPLSARALVKLYDAGEGEGRARSRSVSELEALTHQAARDTQAHRSSAWLVSLLQDVEAMQANDLGDFMAQFVAVLSREHRMTVVGMGLLLLGMACMAMPNNPKPATASNALVGPAST